MRTYDVLLIFRNKLPDFGVEVLQPLSRQTRGDDLRIISTVFGNSIYHSLFLLRPIPIPFVPLASFIPSSLLIPLLQYLFANLSLPVVLLYLRFLVAGHRLDRYLYIYSNCNYRPSKDVIKFENLLNAPFYLPCSRYCN